MQRNIDPETQPELLNPWIRQSLELAAQQDYLDQLLEVYPFAVATPQRLPYDIRRRIQLTHQQRDTDELLRVLAGQSKFPYEDPVWYVLRNQQGAAGRNPAQMARIAQNLYAMTTDELLTRLEAAPAANTQIGPMFGAWLNRRFVERHSAEVFQATTKGVAVFDGSEEAGKQFVRDVLNQDLSKRPDLLAKVDGKYVLGEAKWVGQPGGNQEKQISEVLAFCAGQCDTRRGEQVLRVGIVDGFPWTVRNASGGLIGSKEAVKVQESHHTILSALLLPDYFASLLA